MEHGELIYALPAMSVELMLLIGILSELRRENDASRIYLPEEYHPIITIAPGRKFYEYIVTNPILMNTKKSALKEEVHFHGYVRDPCRKI